MTAVNAPQPPTRRVVEIGSPEMATLKPEDFDPVVIRNLLYFLLGPGWHGKERPAQETNPAAQPAT